MQADKVPEAGRGAAFGVFSGVCTAGFVAGTIAARFLSVSSTFQVSSYLCFPLAKWLSHPAAASFLDLRPCALHSRWRRWRRSLRRCT